MDYNEDLNPLKLLLDSGSNGDEFSRKIADFFPAIIYIYDVDSRKLRYINRKVTDFLGYTFEDVESWDNDFMHLVFKEDIELVKKELHKFFSLKDDESYSYNSRLTHKQGNWRYFRTFGTVLNRDDHDNASSMLFVAQDVTQEMETGSKFRRLEELFNDTQDVLKFGVWEWDVIEDSMVWSSGLYRLFGYDPISEKDKLEINPAFYLQHICDEDRDKVLQNREHLLNHHAYDSYYRIRDRNGRIKDVRDKCKVIRNKKNELQRVIGSTMDVTEQLQLYRDLAEYKRLKQENEAYLGYGTWEFEVASKKFRWSDGMYTLFGYDPHACRHSLEVNEELYKKHIDEDEFEKLEHIRDTMLVKKEEKYSWEFRITANDGNLKKLETSGKVIYDQEGNWIKTIGTSRDITRLSDYQHSLEDKIRDLNRSNKELEEFAYVASHDLNEPLRKITTFIERLNNKYRQELGDDGRMYLNRIVSSVDNMRRLIDTLLEFSRTARSSQPLEMVDLNLVLAEVLADLELKIEETNTAIVADNLPVIEAVPSQMKQVFDNLLNNSIKFRQSQSSPHISINCQKLNKKQKLELNLDIGSTWYKIDFTDNGIGFEPEYSEKIFQIFQRLHGKTEYPGSGIGLAICKKITDHMNGVIYAHGEPGKGAIFTIILPERQ
jgi:PAS domain S-box-containing protein